MQSCSTQAAEPGMTSGLDYVYIEPFTEPSCQSMS